MESILCLLLFKAELTFCKQKNETLVQITLPKDNKQIFASKYQTVLPSKEELRQLIESKE